MTALALTNFSARRICTIVVSLICAGVVTAETAPSKDVVQMHPFEPLVIEAPILEKLARGEIVELLVIPTSGQSQSVHISKINICGKPDGKKGVALIVVFDCSRPSEDVFVDRGQRQIRIKGDEKWSVTVDVQKPSAADEKVLPLLHENVLFRICTLAGPDDLNESTKKKCDEILRLSPDGVYAKYSETYMSIDRLYRAIMAEASAGKIPNPSEAIASLAKVKAPGVLAQSMVLFHLGYARGLTGDKDGARKALRELMESLPESPWSEQAQQMLSELEGGGHP